jgi:flavin-dependent dehydrogenase
VVTWDAVVVGGGPAGSATALELGRRGLRVALVEKAHHPRAKACGEGLLPQGVEALGRLGLNPPGVRVRGIRYVSPGGVTAEASFPSGYGLVVRRETFDAYLFDQARRAPNVVAFEGTPYDPLAFPARWIVGADGIHSQFHRRPEFPSSMPSVRRVGLSTRMRGLLVDRDRVEVLLHERGEVYLAPSGEEEVLVACLYREENLPPGPTNEDRVMGTLVSLEVLEGRRRGLAFASPVLGAGSLGLRVGAVVAGSTLLVGDASGAPDPVTGEGMSLSILSARAAAEAISSGRPRDYEQARRKLGAGADWLGRWLLRASHYPGIADRVVQSLVDHPELFTKLLEIAIGERREGDLSLVDLARLVV